MKKKLLKMLRSGIALLVAASMVCGTGITVFAEPGAETINYVSLGASNTNGYGILGYLPEAVSEDPLAASKADMNVYGYLMAPEEAYPAQVAEALGDTNGPDQLAISSMRVEEVRYLLDDTMEPDAYMEWRFTGGQKWFEIAQEGGVSALREAYADYLSKADYVTVDLGWNNFGVYAFNNIKTILADGNYWKAPELDKYPEEDAMYREIKKVALDKLSANMSGTDRSLKAKLELMADVLVYTTLGACYDYDIVMEKIYELNPDATVVVINIQNLADDLVVEFEGETLNLGDIYGELIDLVNLYRASESPYADKCVYVDAGDVETFLDELVAWDGDPTTLSGDMKDCFDMYDDNLYVRSIVEYMLVGQALSGLFAGVRDMAAGYGLEVFKNDDQYTYEFALERTPEQLLALDLGKLDLNNPAGDDADVETYGKALAKHLKNLRGEGKLDAYDYVFENLLNGLKAQLELAEAASNTAGIAQLTQAIEVIVPGAKAEFDTKLQGVYNTYHNTLNYAYDVVATNFQAVADIDELTIDASSLNGFNTESGNMMGQVFNGFVAGAQNKFYYELEKNGVQTTGALEVPEYNDAEILEGLTPAMTAIAVLAVRYELGNSFFAHPNRNGHDQITDAVMDALENGSDADDFTDAKQELYIGFLKEKYPNLYEVLMGVQNVDASEIDDLAIIINMLKLSDSTGMTAKELDMLEAQIRAAQRDFAEGKTPEEQAEAQAVVYDLMERLYDLAAITSGTNYEAKEDSYYVSVGDSTLTGFGLDGYKENTLNGAGQLVEGSAHVLLAEHLYGDSWKEHFGILTQGASRAEDLLLILGGDFVPDDYFNSEIKPILSKGTLEATQETYIANIKKADLISVTIAGGNFSTFVGRQMNHVMAGKDTFDLEWEAIGMDSEAMDELNEVLDILVPIIDEMGLLEPYLPEEMDSLKGQELAKYARTLAETMLYAYASYNYYYPQVLERIKEINPDAQLLVIGMFNPVDEWSMTTEINGQEVYIPVGGVFGNLFDSANLQRLSFALQNENTSYVDISDTETILEAKNPGKKLTYIDYIDGALNNNGRAVHASEAGHKYIFNQMANSLSLESQVYIVVEELLEIVEIYGPPAYEYAYDYADENGYIDAACDALATAKAELEKLDVNGLPLSDALKAELANAIENAIETIDALDKLLHEADVLDQATLDEAINLLNKLGQNMTDIREILTQAGIEAGAAAWEAYEVLKPIVIEKLKEAVAEGTAWLLEKAQEAYDELVEAAKNYAPVADQFLYDWLYNNPDKVIAFFNEYGDEISAFMAEYGDEALLVLGFLAKTYGPEVLDYVMAHPEETLAAFVDWYNQYGERTWAMIKRYLDYLGVTDAIEDAVDKIKDPEVMKALLEKLCGLVEKYGPEVMEGLYGAAAELLEKYGDELQAFAEELLAKFVEQIRPQVEELIAKLEAQLKALEDELAAKKAELENAIGEAKEKLEAAIAELEKQIAQIKAQIEALNDMLEKAYNEVVAFVNTVKEIVASIDDIIAAIEAQAKEQLAAAIERLEDAVARLNGAVADALEKALAELEAAVKEAIAYVGEETVSAIAALVEGLINDTENTVKAVAEAIKDALNDVYVDATTDDYVIQPDSYYVAMGDSAVTGYGLEDAAKKAYGYKVAKELGLYTITKYSNLGNDLLRIDDINYILGGTDSVDAYGEAVVLPQIDEEALRAQYVSEIEKADLITLGFDNNFSAFMQAQILSAQPYELDWARYVGDEGVVYVAKALEEVANTLAQSGLPADYIGSLLYAVECYAYGYVGFAFNYPAVVGAIHEINPDAQVLLVGLYNPLENMSVAGIDLGGYVDYLVELANAHMTAYAVLAPNTIYIDAPAVETILESQAAGAEVDLITFVANITGGSKNLHASEAGHEYIKDQIIGALTTSIGPKRNPFIDVNEGAYYYDAVMWAVENGITYGKTPTTFEPNSGCTRAQAVAFLWRAAGCPQPKTTVNPFTDVKEGAYYYDAVLWAVENGITVGKTATTFEPKSVCTRSQIVAFMYRTEGEPAVTGENPFVDVNEGAYYYDAVLWAVQNGITFGKTETTFEPKEDCERCHIVSFLYRYANEFLA